MWSLDQGEANSETGWEKPVLFFKKARYKLPWLSEVEYENAIGFFMGTTVGLLVVLVFFHNSTPVSADGSSATTSDGSVTTTVTADDPATTSPDSTDVNGLMPDVKKIYYSALGGP